MVAGSLALAGLPCRGWRLYRPAISGGAPATAWISHIFHRNILRGLIALCVQTEIVGDEWLGGQMSVSDFASRFTRTVFGATLALSIVCAGVSNANAATNGNAAIAAMPFVAPVSPVAIDDAAPASFNERFDYKQSSIARDILASWSIYFPLTPLTTASLPRHQKIVPAGAAIVGIASMYDPTDANDRDSGTEETASGERYDGNGWTAAIRTDLRAQFGGVRFGRNYQAGYALVRNNDKQLIVRINDVGPLKKGRIIDLNRRAMRYFDPTLQLGLIGDVSVTPLAGQDWALGPLNDERPVSFASRFLQ